MSEKLCAKKGGGSSSQPHTETYTFPSGNGDTVDLGLSHIYRYVNASNVYAKGKSDATISISYLSSGSTGNRTLTGSATTTANGYAVVICTCHQQSGSDLTSTCSYDGSSKSANQNILKDSIRLMTYIFPIVPGKTISVTVSTPSTTVYSSAYLMYQVTVS